MGNTVLPGTLIKKIIALKSKETSFNEILASVREEAQSYVKSDDQLARCVQAILRNADEPQPKPIPDNIFQTYQDLFKDLREDLDPKVFEEKAEPIVKALLAHEGFQKIFNANTESGYMNPPFDFLGFKEGIPYMIEFKGSLEHFNAPGETQKRRLHELKENISKLHVGLLQIAFSGGKEGKGEYRFLVEEEMDHLFTGYQIPLEKLENWINEQIKKSSPAVKPA